MAARRPLTFSSLDEVMPDVERLLQNHTTVGNWSLGQILNHLEGSIRSSVEGYTEQAPWVLRKFVGPIVMTRIINKGVIPEGIKTNVSLVPKPGLDCSAEAEGLRAALALFMNHTGRLADHPFGGPFSREKWEKVHRLHAAHHLSFALPARGTSLRAGD
jgi:hypothetical protein